MRHSEHRLVGRETTVCVPFPRHHALPHDELVLGPRGRRTGVARQLVLFLEDASQTLRPAILSWGLAVDHMHKDACFTRGGGESTIEL